MLTEAGVYIARGYTVDRLWSLEEEGDLPLLEVTTKHGLRRTTPRYVAHKHKTYMHIICNIT
jgi:hypothetical protein